MKLDEMKEKSSKLHKISDVLSILMKERGVKDAELAMLTKIPVSSISKLRLKYTDNPTVETLLPLADYFGVSVDQLLGRQPIDGVSVIPARPIIEAYPVPIIELSEVQAWIAGDLCLTRDHAKINVDLPVTEGAFAIIAKGSLVTPVLHQGAMLIFDQLKNNEMPKDCSYVMAVVPRKEKKEMSENEFSPSELPGLKEIRFDGSDFFLAPLNADLSGLVKNPVCTILAVMREIKILL